MKRQKIGSTATNSHSKRFATPDLGCFLQHCNPFGDCQCTGSTQKLTEEDQKHQHLLLASGDALDSLTEVEKDRVYNDLYGTADAIEESEAFVNKKINDLQQAIDDMMVENKADYLLALNEENRQGTTYVQSVKFILMFLRAATFNSAEAAVLICNFFKAKKELFGLKKLPRRIVESDLDEDDREALYSGCLFICNGMDHCDRMALFFSRREMHFKNIMNFKRAFFYYIVSSIEDNTNAQKMGVMEIFYDIGHTQVNRCQLELIKNYKSIDHFLTHTLPFRIACVHHCYSDSIAHIFVSLALSIQRALNAARIKSYLGSHQHCRREMAKYGICLDLFPVDRHGVYDRQMLKRSLKKLRKKQEQEPSCSNNYPMPESLGNLSDDSSIGSY